MAPATSSAPQSARDQFIEVEDRMQDVVVNERRFKYEGQVKQDPLNYDAWFDYIRLEESAGDHDKIREVSQHCLSLLCCSLQRSEHPVHIWHIDILSKFQSIPGPSGRSLTSHLV